MAQEILAFADPDTSTQKIRYLCEDELRYIARHGFFNKNLPNPSGSLLWSILTALKHFFHAETQCIEGINSIIRIAGKRSPNISLELLASRLIIKRSLGLHTQNKGSLKFSVMKPFAESLVLELMKFKVACLTILSDQSRWASCCPFKLTTGDSEAIQDQGGDDRDDEENAGDTLAIISDSCVKLLAQALGVPCDASSGDLVLHDCDGHDAMPPQPQPPTEEMVDQGLWAKSYNLGYKWRTGGGKKFKPGGGKTTGPVVLPHRGPGVAIVEFLCHPPPSSPRPDADPIVEYFLVTDRFSHSVLFTRLRTEVDPSGVRSLVWDPFWATTTNSACIPSTKLMAVFYKFCVHDKGTVDIHSVYLSCADSVKLFSPAGGLPLGETMGSSLLLLTMTEKCMKGVAVKYRQRKRAKADPDMAADPLCPEALGDAGADAHPGAEESEEELHSDDAGNLSVSSGSDRDESDADDESQTLDPPDILQHATSSISSFKSAPLEERPDNRDVTETMSNMMQGDNCTTSAELEEEALLFLIRQRNLQKHATNDVSPAFEGVGPGRITSQRSQRPATVNAASSSSDEDEDHCPSASASASSSANLPTCPIDKWVAGCAATIKSFLFLRGQSIDKLGKDRSISLVLMKQKPKSSSVGSVSSCSCIRCKWPDSDLPDLIWVSWLNNSLTHGLLGRTAREVKLDAQNRVLYSVADARMIKTGCSQGFGYPQLLCDSAHSDILIPVVGATMRKVTKRQGDRDYVHPDALRIFSFCELMLSMTAADQEDRHGLTSAIDRVCVGMITHHSPLGSRWK